MMKPIPYLPGDRIAVNKPGHWFHGRKGMVLGNEPEGTPGFYLVSLVGSEKGRKYLYNRTELKHA